ncbi:MAG TPA: glycosyltransferase family 2 protein [Myxococcales bacterium]|nr:glycosyltransferase family 2 protein [Myxococcales bacterium]
MSAGARDCFVSVVAPLSDDSAILGAFVDEAVGVLRAGFANYELVLVDDGSVDDTAAAVTPLLERHPCLRYIRLSRSFGPEAAIASGLDSTIGDFVVVMTPDTDPPQLIPQMVDLARSGIGTVYGVRRTRRGDPWWLRAGASAFYFFCARLLGVRLAKNSTHFRVLSRQTVNAVTRIKDRNRYLRVLTASVGYSAKAISYEPLARHGRDRHKTFSQSVSLAINIMVTQSTHPLRLVSWLGLGASLVNLGYLGYVVLVYLLKSKVAEGWTTLSLQVGGMFFLVFLILSVMAEYLGRLMEETRERPLYHVLEERSSNVLLADPERRNVVSESAAAPASRLEKAG